MRVFVRMDDDDDGGGGDDDSDKDHGKNVVDDVQ